MAKFRLRHLMEKVPFLDGLRLSFLAGFCQHGSDMLDKSYPVTKLVPDSARNYLAGDKPALFASYHGRMFGMLQLVQRREQISILISDSRDGEIISRALTNLGFTINRGSSKRGAVKGGIQVVKSALSGRHQVLMVDGPRGPIYDVKSGIIRLAAMTGLPIIPFVCSGKYYVQMWGWDKFIAPDWGSPVVYMYGEPIFVAKGANAEEIERARTKLERKMSRLRTLADEYWSLSA
jgi:lysophospholipid acyltransferase (LPLAT)-like uncharacterized protein